MKPKTWMAWVPMLVFVAACGDDDSSAANNNNNDNTTPQCIDGDGDSYGVGAACQGADCDDADDQCWEGLCCLPPGCTDPDGDGYGEGADCQGADCNEEDDQCWLQGAACCGAPACDDVWHDGPATYYTFADGSGACSFPPTPNDLLVAAMNAPDYGNSEPCGSCLLIQGPDGDVTVRVVDLCPECPVGHVDLSPEAFELIAPLSAGIVDVTWQYIPCNVTGPIRYFFKDGSNQWWTAVQIRNHRHAIDRFEYQEAGGAWIEVDRVDYNFFVETSGMGPGPYTFRVTDIHGAVLTDSNITFVEAGEVDGAAQFPPCE